MGNVDEEVDDKRVSLSCIDTESSPFVPSLPPMQKAKTGMLMYEQDWLDDEFDRLAAFGT